jgi:hypothetical protein
MSSHLRTAILIGLFCSSVSSANAQEIETHVFGDLAISLSRLTLQPSPYDWKSSMLEAHITAKNPGTGATICATLEGTLNTTFDFKYEAVVVTRDKRLHTERIQPGESARVVLQFYIKQGCPTP